MFLKSIELLGFKSFAEKTTLIFKPGVTAIVGPNGCGKSNIVDAIRWVLGETNARSIRGEVMEDVIFSGSETRKPLGMAEVSITFLNEDNLLPVEYSEVTVTRRLYRSGESEYLINRNSVRLKDIVELFTDTGIGKPAYSIMEQGNIDVILSNKPEERLSLFEEAAGINRYKLKIKDAYRNLQATEDNLARVDLIINEVEKELKALEVQAENAKKYKQMRKEELEYETLYRIMVVQNFEEKINQNNQKIEEIKKSIEEKSIELEKINQAVDGAFESVKETEKRVSTIKNGLYKREKDCETISSKVDHYEERISFLREEKRKKEEIITKTKNDKNLIAERLEKLRQEKNDLETLINSQEEKLRSCNNEIELIRNKLDLVKKNINDKTNEIRMVEVKLDENRSALTKVVDDLLVEIDNIRKRYERKELSTKKRASEALKLIDDFLSQLKHFSNKINDIGILTGGEAIKIHRAELLTQVDEFKNKLLFIKNALESVFRHEEEVYSAIFGKDSLHSKKLEIEDEIIRSIKHIENLKEKIGLFEEERSRYTKRINNLKEIVSMLTPDLARNREKLSFLIREATRLENEIDKIEDIINEANLDILSYEETERKLSLDVKDMRAQIRSIELEVNSGRSEIEELNKRIEDFLVEIKNKERKADRLKSSIEKDRVSLDNLERENIQLKSRIDTIIYDFRESYNVSLDLVDRNKIKDLTIEEINRYRKEIKDKIAGLGRVNLLAIEDYEEIKERYSYLITQKNDLQKAKDDINLAIGKTLETAREIFLTSFEKIKINFGTLYRRLFGGGKAELYLTNESNIFESGVELMVNPPGKTLRRRSLLSGGEKGLTAVALLFSIFMVKPSPFCILDEVDHDLDEENIMRFLKLLKEFTDFTQFIIITHNRRTIEFADIIYGITSEEAGVSKVVSLDLMRRNVG